MDNNKYIVDFELIVIVVVVVVGAIVLTKVSRWFIDKSFTAASEKLKVDPTRYKFFKNAVALIIWLVALGVVVSLVPKLKALTITLFASAGILVALIGFAAQQAFSNIISGIFIVIFKPFRVGDLIKVGDKHYGVVEDITLRHTIINNFENKRVIIPNSVISDDTIINDSIEDAKVCVFIEVGISYDSDVDLAAKIIQEETVKHPFNIDVRTNKEKKKGEDRVEVRLLSFGDSSLNLRGYAWASDPFDAFRMKSDIFRSIKIRFEQEGVEIPFPYRTVVYKNDLPKNAKLKKDE